MKGPGGWAALTLAALCACGPEPVPAPAPGLVGTWAGQLTNATVGASYAYRATFAGDGSATVTNEQNRTVGGDWSTSGGVYTVKFLINSNNVVLVGQITAQNTFAGSALIGRDDVGVFSLARQP